MPACVCKMSVLFCVCARVRRFARLPYTAHNTHLANTSSTFPVVYFVIMNDRRRAGGDGKRKREISREAKLPSYHFIVAIHYDTAVSNGWASGRTVLQNNTYIVQSVLRTGHAVRTAQNYRCRFLISTLSASV